MKNESRNFARRKDGLGAQVCKDIPPKSRRKKDKFKVPNGKIQHRVSIPPEWEAALQAMYPSVSVAIAIRRFIVANLEPLNLQKEDEHERPR